MMGLKDMYDLKKSFYGITVRFSSDIRYHDHDAIDCFEEYLYKIARSFKNKSSRTVNNIYVAKISDIYFLNCCNFNGNTFFNIIEAKQGIRSNSIYFLSEIDKNLVKTLLPGMEKATKKIQTYIDNRERGLNNLNIIYGENITNYWFTFLERNYNYDRFKSENYEK